MKKIIGYFIAYSFVLALPFAKAWAQPKPFEGNITITGTANDKSMVGVAHVKGTHIEMDGGSTLMGDAKIFIDTRLQKITRVFGSHGMEN